MKLESFNRRANGEEEIRIVYIKDFLIPYAARLYSKSENMPKTLKGYLFNLSENR